MARFLGGFLMAIALTIVGLLPPANVAANGAADATPADSPPPARGGRTHAAPAIDTPVNAVVTGMLAERAAERVESVGIPDQRVRRTPTTAWPASALTQIVAKIAGGYALCSGVFVGENVVLTAAHCLYDPDGGGWPIDLVVVPGMDGSALPYGSFRYSNLWVPDGWANAADRRDADPTFDWGVITVAQPAGRTVGHMKVGVLTDATLRTANLTPHSAGYPGDKPQGTQWWGQRPALTNIDANFLIHDLDVYNGQSGSPVWRAADGAVIGIVSFDARVRGTTRRVNVAHRVNEQLLADVTAACARMNCTIDSFREGAAGQPAPNPVPGSPFVASAAGEGCVALGGANRGCFALSVGARPDGGSEGWLVYTAPGLGRFEATSVGAITVADSRASFWAFGRFAGDGRLYAVSVQVDAPANALALQVQDAATGARVHTAAGPVQGGALTAAGALTTPSSPPVPR